MRTAIKVWLIIAASLVLVGAIVFAAVMVINNGDFSKLGTTKYKTETYEFSEKISNISIDTRTSDLVFLPSDDEKTKIVCYEEEKLAHSVEIEEDTLVIKLVDERKWYELIGINTKTPSVTLYLPESEYRALKITNSTGDIDIPRDFKFESVDITLTTGDVDFCASAASVVRISTSTGDISLEGASAESFELCVSTGEIEAENVTCSGEVNITVDTGRSELDNVRCKRFSSTGDTGDIYLENVIVEEKLSVERSTGDVRFEACDAGEIYINTSTGDVRGNFLTDKIVMADSSTGDIRVPTSTNGGLCEISTSTGDITVTIGK